MKSSFQKKEKKININKSEKIEENDLIMPFASDNKS